MGHTFGLFSKSQKGVLFANMRAKVADKSPGNPNHPAHLPQSPNAPRSETDRYGEENNPILGDPGYGQIGRWQTVQLDALENSIDQMIEQYLKDKTWYASVRCREALWNMYRRIEWWVEQQHPPDKTQYQRVLQMIKDCIHKILENAQKPGGSHHGVSLPVCPAPYYHHFSGNYFNHFDAKVYEIPLFSMKKDVPFSNKFPDFFRYVSSTEDQEWVTVHSVGKNEQSGSEMILKLNLGLLQIGNSSKITFNWRVKRYGQIRFKYMVSAKRGNGMLFYINGQQVGGEWSENTSWQEAAFTLQPGQMYKFDWLIRKMRPEVWQNNGIYIKDIEVVEIVDTRKPPAPLDRDLDGEQWDSDWVVKSSQSIAQAHFQAQFITDEERSKTMKMNLDNECDATVSFAYYMGIDKESYPIKDYDLFFDDIFKSRTQHGESSHNSQAQSVHGVEWNLNEEYSETTTNQAKIEYEIVAGPDTTVDLKGVVEVVCPSYEIDHWKESLHGRGLGNYQWQMSGSPSWVKSGNVLRLDEPLEGDMIAQTEVNLQDEGWFLFSYSHQLRATESFEVTVNGMLEYYSTMHSQGEQIRIPLEEGLNIIQFYIRDYYTEQPFIDNLEKLFTYGNNTGNTYRSTTRLGSYVDVTRGWDVTDAGARTERNGDTIRYNAELNPGAKFSIQEHMRIYPAMDSSYNPVTGVTRDFKVFEELFNDEGQYHESLRFSGNWVWKKIVNGDGVMWAQGHDQDFICDFEAHLVNSGYICWQYGGQFDPGEKLELQIDGISVWTGSQSNDLEGTNCMYPLPPGNHQFRWRYRDGKKYTPDNEEGGSGNGSGTSSGTGTGSDQQGGATTDPYRVKCYTWGSKTDNIQYAQKLYGGHSPRAAKFDATNKGDFISSDEVGTTKQSSTIVRTFTAPKIGDLHYSELLTVYPVTKKRVLVKRTLNNKSAQYIGAETISKSNGTLDYYSLDVSGNNPQSPEYSLFGSDTKKIIFDFYCVESFDIDLKYLCHLTEGTLAGRFRIAYHPKNNTDKAVTFLDRTINVGDNEGYNSKQLGTTHWTKAEKYSKTITVDKPGQYTLIIGLTDTINGYERGKKSNYYYAAVKGLTVKTDDPDGVNQNKLLNPVSSDQTTYVNVQWYDLTANRKFDPIQIKVKNGQKVSEYISSPSSLIPEHKYKVVYTLHKDKTSTSATGLGAGGFTLSEGSFYESWPNYCTDANGNMFPEGNSPHPGPEPWTPPDTTAPDGGSHAWLDVIRLYKNTNRACSGTKIVIDTYEEGRLLHSRDVTNQEDQMITIEVENTSDEKRKYEVQVRFVQGCPGDGAMIWGGKLHIEDIIKIAPSWAEVTHFEVWNNKPIWMGGCDNSNMHVKIIREDGKVFLDEKYYGHGFRGFEINDLSPKPYSKYKVEITTDQQGKISEVTGKPYLTTFRLQDFKAYERWVWVPVPFDCQLDFFIDNTLIQTFTKEGGYYTFSHPVPKGKHEFKWVFTSMQEAGTRSYEYANLDWMELTNWICDDVYIIPYCEGGGGDQCVEALIKCLLEVWKSRPKMCVIGKRIWLFT
ncbi:hypothetical protein [Paenibacillus sp. TC-CSREp1]|uniref:hypothetical protein n=1 Tax=Paenibacillus sp. TC-CSREp1 TaxID=3410089 RepID=UPI003CE808AB